MRAQRDADAAWRGVTPTSLRDREILIALFIAAPAFSPVVLSPFLFARVKKPSLACETINLHKKDLGVAIKRRKKKPLLPLSHFT